VVGLSHLLATARFGGCSGDQPWGPSQAAGRSVGLKTPGPGSGEADHAGAPECRRSDGSGGVARSHSEIGLGGTVGETGNGARLAPRTSAKEVGGIPGPTAPSPAADLSRVPSADSADGAREPALGYFRIRGELLKLGHRVAATTIRSVLIAARVPPAGRRSQPTWKQIPERARRDPGCRRFLQRRHDLLQAALRPLYMCIWRRVESCWRAAPRNRMPPGLPNRLAISVGDSRMRGSISAC